MIEDKEIEIVKLEFPENVRKRPGKLIGSVDNCNVLLREIVDNAVDEVFGCASCNSVNIYIDKENYIYTVTDNGRGIPIKFDPAYNCTKAQLAISEVDAGSKFEKDINSVAVGQNGVGSSAVNALSTDYQLYSRITENNWSSSIPLVADRYLNSEGKMLYYHLQYSKGIKQLETVLTYEEMTEKLGVEVPMDSMTIVQFHPDDSIFNSLTAVLPEKNIKYLKAITKEFYNKLVSVRLNGAELESSFEPYPYKFKTVISRKVYDAEDRILNFYISLNVNSDLTKGENTGSVNSLVVNNGLHINFAKSAYAEAMSNSYSLPTNFACAGLSIDVIVMAGEVDFSSQTKERLTYLDGFTSSQIIPNLTKEFLNIIRRNKDVFDVHAQRIREYINSITKISTINKVKNMVKMADTTDQTRLRSSLAKNVSDASSNKRNECTLYIVEGDSAAGTILKSRNVKTDAVFQLRGVPKNTVNCSLDELFDNAEMKGLISAIGCGVNEYFSMKNPRYGKIIIAADADPDGGKIASLVIGMIASRMTFLIEAEMVFVLDSPLYKQDGKYIYPQDDVESLLDRSKMFERFKGLGELDTEEAKDIILDPNIRRLKCITKEDCDLALLLLTNSGARKELMISNKVVTDPYGLGIYY